jgi:hypothetical protein
MASITLLLCLASAVLAVNPRLIPLSTSNNATSVASAFVPRDSSNQCPAINSEGGTTFYQVSELVQRVAKHLY